MNTEPPSRVPTLSPFVITSRDVITNRQVFAQDLANGQKVHNQNALANGQKVLANSQNALANGQHAVANGQGSRYPAIHRVQCQHLLR